VGHERLSFCDDRHDRLVAAARALRPLLERNAQTHEDDGELVPEVVDGLERAEFFKMSAPRRCHGIAASSHTMASVTAELARVCPSTAWIVSIVHTNVWVASRLGLAMQKLIFADGVPRIVSPSNGIGTVTDKSGKLYLSGSWSYGSASHHSDWAVVPARDPAGVLCMAAMPMREVEIDRTWLVTGMKGTGSDSLIADKVLISEAQLSPLDGLGSETTNDAAFVREATDYWPGLTMLRCKALGVVVGAAEGLLETVMENKQRPIIYSTYGERGQSQAWQAKLGQAAAQISTARAMMDQHNRFNDDAARGQRLLTYAERAKIRAEVSVICEMLIAAVETLMNLAGSSAYMLKNPAQRFWRDFSIAVRHVIFNIDLGFEVYGKQLLGIEPNVIPSEYL
jgi:alkylation response protein AidB-like acyl-CoA dehydrogenase